MDALKATTGPCKSDCPECGGNGFIGGDKQALWACTVFTRRLHAHRNAAPELYEALEGAIGALEFSRDYHSDLGNEEQAFAQDRLDAALKALARARGAAA